MDNRIHVLQVISGMGSGGAEMFLMNMYRNMDHDRIVFDFLLQSDENIYQEELSNYGSTVFQIPPYYRNPLKNHSELRKVLKAEYSAVHVHANAMLYIAPIIYADKAGIPIRIMHSHSTSMYYKWALLYHNLNKKRADKHLTHRFACSEEAGKWMFDSSFSVIRNAVDLDRFGYRDDLRVEYRKELGLKDGELTIGQIGRLGDVKNQSFTLDVFREVLNRHRNSSLLFIGEGSSEDALRNKAQKLGVADKVQFLGVRNDVDKIINAIDVLLFPSLYEGMPLVLIEAQANGLSTICSTAIPTKCVFAKNIKRIPLELGVIPWADAVVSICCNRTYNRKELIEAGYDIHIEAKKLQDFYLNTARER